MAGDPLLESLFDSFLLGDAALGYRNFKLLLNGEADARVEGGEILLGCLHACILAY